MNGLVKLPGGLPKPVFRRESDYCFVEFFLESPGALPARLWVGQGGVGEGQASGYSSRGRRQVRDTAGQLPGFNKCSPCVPPARSSAGFSHVFWKGLSPAFPRPPRLRGWALCFLNSNSPCRVSRMILGKLCHSGGPQVHRRDRCGWSGLGGRNLTSSTQLGGGKSHFEYPYLRVMGWALMRCQVFPAG